MKRSIQTALLIALVLLFSACTGGGPQTPKVDMTLPQVTGIQVLSDVDSIAFEWQISKDNRVEGYRIYRAKDGDELEKIAEIDTKYSTHYVDKNLRPDHEYIYQFAAYGNEGIDSQRSELIRARTLALEPVAYIEAISNYPKKIKVIWRPHDNPRVNGYTLERTIGISNDWKRVAQTDSRLYVEYIDEDLRDNMLYRYRVIAKGYSGVESKPSQIAEAKTRPTPKPLQHIVASTDLPKKVVIEWQPSSESRITKYRAYRSPLAKGWYQQIIETESTKIVDKIEKDGAVYFYKVTAVDADGLEGEMPNDYIVGKTLAKPIAPHLISATITGSGIELRWESGDSRAASYRVIRKDGFLSGEERTFTNIKAYSFTDREVEPGKKYSYYVVSIDENGLISDESEEAEIAIPENRSFSN